MTRRRRRDAKRRRSRWIVKRGGHAPQLPFVSFATRKGLLAYRRALRRAFDSLAPRIPWWEFFGEAVRPESLLANDLANCGKPSRAAERIVREIAKGIADDAFSDR